MIEISPKQQSDEEYQNFVEIVELLTTYFATTEEASLAIIRYFMTIRRKSRDYKIDEEESERTKMIRKQLQKYVAKKRQKDIESGKILP